jgi:hypothetical protein
MMKKNSPITEKQLREMFDRNLERLRLENGHSLAPGVLEAAWEQVRAYYRKLRNIAERVTETEVKLNLPNQRTRKKRNFCIEGVVDIVREGKKVTMYDIKTHDLSFIEKNINLYSDQLNVYAYIWQNLRGQRLDETAIISTPVPEKVSVALSSGDQPQIEIALAQWNPIVPIPFDAGNVERTIAEFAKVVDKIEDQKFQPAPVEKLIERDGDTGTFATRVCRNCDLRFSCSSYRKYARKYKDRGWSKFADFYDLEADEAESIARFAAIASDEGDGARGAYED